MKKITFMKTLLVAVGLLAGTSAWAQTTWTFLNNTAVWAAGGVTLSGGNQYDENASAVATGGVTFTGSSGFVSTAKGIGFYAVGSTSDENISIVVPAGFKATVSILTSGNRTVVADFGGATQTFNANWASSTKEFNNVEGVSDVTLYLYCNQNAGGADQKKAPFLESIVLTDMSTVSSYPWKANAVATISGNKTTLKTYNSSADVDEGSQYTVVVDKVIKYEEEFYELKDAQFATNVFGKTFTMENSAPTHEFTYEKIDDVVFYGEVEDIFSEGVRANKADGVNVLSNGGGYSAMGTEGYIKLAFSVPETGAYTLALGMNNTNGSNRGFNYAIDDAEVSETFTVKANTPHVQEIVANLKSGEHTITMNITYSLTPVFDYLLITKIAPIVPSSNDTGFLTYASDFALDFTGLTTKAYIATSVADGKVALTQVNKVPAGTGLILERANGSAEAIPVLSGDADDVSANKLARGTGAAVDAGYVLVNRAGTAEFAGIGTDKPVVAKDQAYLNIAAEAPYLQFVFAESETTGISTVKAAAVNGAIYNLNGQRVAKGQKGLYIMNGKKVVLQ